MSELKFCPKCGHESLNWDGEKKWSCGDCDFVLFHNCAAAVAVILRHEDEYMFTRRNQDPAKGKLDLAGGFTDPKESSEETCARELYEELKVRIDLQKLKILGTEHNVYHYKGIDYNTLDIFFEYALEKKFEAELELSEVSEIVWLKKEEIRPEDIAFESQKRFLEKYFQ